MKTENLRYLDGSWEQARLRLGCLSTELGVWVLETCLNVAECGKEGPEVGF